jgi:hypothetical protein
MAQTYPFDQLEHEIEEFLSEQQLLSSDVSEQDDSQKAHKSFEGTNALLKMALASRRKFRLKARLLHARVLFPSLKHMLHLMRAFCVFRVG